VRRLAVAGGAEPAEDTPGDFEAQGTLARSERISMASREAGRPGRPKRRPVLGTVEGPCSTPEMGGGEGGREEVGLAGFPAWKARRVEIDPISAAASKALLLITGPACHGAPAKPTLVRGGEASREDPGSFLQVLLVGPY